MINSVQREGGRESLEGWGAEGHMLRDEARRAIGRKIVEDRGVFLF